MEFALGAALSHHLLAGDWNELHPYVRAEQHNALNLGPFDGYGFGAYHNSEGKPSLYGGLIGGADPFWWELGLATGYSGAPVVPFGRVGVDLTNNLRAFVAPAYDQHRGAFGPVFGIEGDIAQW